MLFIQVPPLLPPPRTTKENFVATVRTRDTLVRTATIIRIESTDIIQMPKNISPANSVSTTVPMRKAGIGVPYL